jgi:hypothetical protein
VSERTRCREFRDWLVNRVAETSWASNRFEPGEPVIAVASLALQMGVQPDVLVDARRLIDAREREVSEQSGLERLRRRGDGRKVLVAGKKHIAVRMPMVVHQHWGHYRDLRGLTDATLLRSLVHYLLLNPHVPNPRQHEWFYQGEVLRLHGLKAANYQWPWCASTDVNRGAAEALVRRAKAVREAQASLLRRVILDVLEGRLTHFELVPDAAMMFSVDRYLTLEGKLAERAVTVQKNAKRRVKK